VSGGTSPNGWVSHAVASVTTKYAQPEELEYSRGSVSQGLGPDEAALVGRFFDPASRVLDVGCGAGREAIALAHRGLRVTAIDVVAAMIEQARREAAHAGVTVTFEVKSVTAFDAPPNSFDHVLFSLLVYAYIPSPGRRIDTLKRVRGALRKGGTVVFSAYNRKAIPASPKDSLRDGARRLMRWLAPNGGAPEPGDRWVRGVSEASRADSPLCFCHFATVEEVEDEIRQAGLSLEQVTTFEELVQGARLSPKARARVPTLFYVARW